MRRLIAIWFSLCLCTLLHAQVSAMTTLVGEVYDERTGQPIEAVSVYLKNTPYGTTTTPEGIFLLRAPLTKKAVLVVSAVGYHKQQFAVAPGISAGVDVALKEKSHRLEEVFVLPGSNPALPLMERVRQHRRQNDNAADWDAADRELDVAVSDIRAKHLRRSLWRNLQKAMLTADDSTLLLPLYHRRTQQGVTRENTALFTSSDWQILLSDFDHTTNFYQNTVPFLATSFLSPLATDGNHYYHYYLADSTNTDGKVYEVHFRTRNPFYATFNGTMHIDSATAALTAIEAEVPLDANVNYLRGLTVKQTFRKHTEDSIYLFIKADEQVRMLLDFAVKQDTTHLFPSVLLTAENHFTPSLTARTDSHSDTLWQRQDSLLADLPIFRVATFAATLIQTAYIPTGTMVDIGKIPEIIHANPQEMVRLGLPLRTNERFSKTVCLEAYAAYGFGDHAWKGAGMVHLNLPTTRRNTLTFRYADEYVRADVSEMTRLRRENSVWFKDMDINMHIMQMIRHWEAVRNPAVRRREARISTKNDWTENIETRLVIAYGKEGYNMPTRNYDAQPTFRYASLKATIRLAWQEKKTDLFFHRYHHYSALPVLFLNAEAGSIRMAGEENYHLYSKLGVMIRQRADLGIGGRLDWLLEGGVLFGKVPYTRLQLFEGNQSYAYDPYRFTLMDYGEFAADRYLLFHAEWNGKGCLFNRIPGIRHLRLRELLNGRIAWGGWSQTNALCLPSNQLLTTLNIPYIEVGVGIGNILRIADIWSVWRLTHRTNTSDPLWAIRFRLHIES